MPTTTAPVSEVDDDLVNSVLDFDMKLKKARFKIAKANFGKSYRFTSRAWIGLDLGA